MDTVTPSSLEQTEGFASQKRLMLVLMVALTALFSVLDVAFASVRGWERTSFLLDSFSFGFLLLVWCSADARLHAFRLGTAFRVWIFLFGIIAFPVYAFKTRGRGGWKLLARSLLFCVLLFAVAFFVDWITEVIAGHLGRGRG